jgi:signal transduction histidine kinase
MLVGAAVSLIRTVRDFYRLDFPVSWVESGVVVDEVPPGSSAATAGLRQGDLIVGVDGTQVELFEDPAFVLAGGSEHMLTIERDDGSTAEIRLVSPPPTIDADYLAGSAVAFFAIGCALYVLWTSSRREAATFVLLATAALVVSTVPTRTALGAAALGVIWRMAAAALPFLIVRFFAVYPENPRSLWFLDLVTVVLAVAAGVSARTTKFEAWWQVAYSLLEVLFYLSLVYGIVTYTLRWREAAGNVRVRRQIEWVALGLFVGLVPLLVLVVVPDSMDFEFEPFSWLCLFPMAVIPLSIAAGLREYRLWDLEPITRDMVSATLVIVTGGFVFALTNSLLLSYSAGLGSLRNLFAFATGVLLVVLLQPVRLRVERSLDMLLYRGRPTPRTLLTTASRELAQITDPRELLVRLSTTLTEGMEIDLVATYLRVADDSFERVTGEGGGLPDLLPAGIFGDEYPTPDELAMAEAGYTVRVPLERVGTTHGLLYLGLRRGIFPLGTEGGEAVSSLAAQAALALESARYLDDLRRQAEEYRILHTNTQRIIESSAAAILVCDAAAHILSANRQAAGLFNREAQELVGSDLGALLDLPEAWRIELPLHAVNTEAKTLARPTRRVILAVSVLELDSGSFNGRVVVLQDVTELRDLQDRMRDQERLASLGRLASGLAHEINTPLTGISSFAQMLGEMTPDDDPRANLVSKLVDQSFRVSRIVSNLRTMVRGSSDSRMVLEVGGVVVRAAKEAARSLGAEERLDVEPAEEPVMVWASVAPLELSVGNLVRNAIEASPADGRIRFSVDLFPEWAEIVVEDSGPGLPNESEDRIFEPFFTTKNDRGGTGLGLAITRDMIAQLGGEVEIENLADGGARATIRLQRWQEPEQSS